MELKQELTIRDLMEMFDKSRRTIYDWKEKGLESKKLQGNGLCDPVRFDLDKVKEFAKEYDKEIINPIYSNSN